MDGFENLSNAELNDLLNAPPLIALLIAGADGDFDREESYWSNRLVQARTYSSPKALNEYYQEVSDNFAAKIDFFSEFFPQNPHERCTKIAETLGRLNDVLPKLPSEIAGHLYKGWIGLAEETAKASGGFLRIGAVSSAEHRWVSLPMLQPVAAPSNDDDSDIDEDKEE